MADPDADRGRDLTERAFQGAVRIACEGTLLYTLRWETKVKGRKVVYEKYLEGTRCTREDYLEDNGIDKLPHAYTLAHNKTARRYGPNPELFDASVEVVTAPKPTG